MLDPYLGSTEIAALKHERNPHGCDTVQSYIYTASGRLLQLRSGTLCTRAMHKPVYEPPTTGTSE